MLCVLQGGLTMGPARVYFMTMSLEITAFGKKKKKKKKKSNNKF